MTKANYLAYYELHEIPWELPAPVRFRDSDSGTLFELERGPYHVPRLASPIVSVRAGGARIETVNENYVLEGATYFGVAVPVRLNADKGALIEPAFEKLFQTSDDAARVVGLCLNQRIPLKKVAAYVKENRHGKPGRMLVMWQAWSGAAASISDKTVESVRSALDHALRSDVSPQVLLALRWYDQSKSTTTVGPDRLVALWIALEALMAPVKTHAELVRKTAAHLAGPEYELGLTPEQTRATLGLDMMLECRNRIMHRGEWPVPWPVALDDPVRRDWPQILSDLVGEILRTKLSTAVTGILKKHTEDGLRMLSQGDQLKSV